MFCLQPRLQFADSPVLQHVLDEHNVQGRIQDFRRGFISRKNLKRGTMTEGLGDGSPPAGSRGSAPCRGPGASPQKLNEFMFFNADLYGNSDTPN